MVEIRSKLRDEMYITSINQIIEEDHEARVYDAIIDVLDIEKLGYVEKERKNNSGRPKYPFKTLLKLYVYGYRLGIRSGKKLENLCKYDSRLIWLLKGLTPDANTINDFRKNNKEILKECFYEVNRIFRELKLLNIDNISQDGFKIKASNSKDKNFTVNKLAERIQRETKEIEKNQAEVAEIEKYIEDLEKSEEKEKIEEEIELKKQELIRINEEIAKKEKLLNEHQEYLKGMHSKNLSQISITDKDSKLMRNNGKYEVCYNVQGAVGVEDHLVTAFTADSNPADIGSLAPMAEELHKEYEIEEVITNTTDKGYQSITDMAQSLELGVIPQVTPMDKSIKEVEIELEYEPTEITEEERKSKKKEDIKKVLRSGEIPECYKENISKIEVVEKQKEKEIEHEVEETRSDNEIREEAIKNGTFERNLKTNMVYCPQGEVLNKKSTNGKNRERFCNKYACRNCKNPCCKSKFKVVEFRTNQKTVIPKGSLCEKPRQNTKIEKERKTVVKVTLKLNQELLTKRMQTSEHSQGTMKTADNHSCFYVRGKAMIEADLSIHFMSSNIRRVINMVGIPKLMKLIEEFNKEYNKCLFSCDFKGLKSGFFDFFNILNFKKIMHV